jgi:hypothetical protein
MVVVLGDAGAIEAAAAVDSDDWSTTVAVARATGYVRAQLVASNGNVEALTSAMWWPPAG